jgi:hypothetical protein
MRSQVFIYLYFVFLTKTTLHLSTGSRGVVDLVDKYIEACKSEPLWSGLHHSEGFYTLRQSPRPHTLSDEQWSLNVAKVLTNTFRTSGGGQTWLILRLPTSICNHSCEPNAAAYELADASNLIVAIKPIKKDEEVTICYNSDLFILPTERRQLALEPFGFQCSCTRCSRGAEAMTELDKDLIAITTDFMSYRSTEEKIKQLYDQLQRAFSTLSNIDEASAFVAQCSAYLQEWPIHRNHWMALNMRKWLAKSLLELAEFDSTQYTYLCHTAMQNVIDDEILYYPANHFDRLIWLNTWMDKFPNESPELEAERTRLLSLSEKKPETFIISCTKQLQSYNS